MNGIIYMSIFSASSLIYCYKEIKRVLLILLTLAFYILLRQLEVPYILYYVIDFLYIGAVWVFCGHYSVFGLLVVNILIPLKKIITLLLYGEIIHFFNSDSFFTINFIFILVLVLTNYLTGDKAEYYEKEVRKYSVFIVAIQHIINTVLISYFNVEFVEKYSLLNHNFITVLFVLMAIFNIVTFLFLDLYNRNVKKVTSINTNLKNLSRKREVIADDSINDFYNKLKIESKSNNYIGMSKLVNAKLKDYQDNSTRVNMIGLNDDILESYIINKLNVNSNVIYKINSLEPTQGFTKYNKYFFEVFGILFDNAYEAASNSEGKYLELSIFSDSIRIKNSYNVNDLSSLKEKSSLKGDKDRLNGLKIIDYLLQQSDLTVYRTIDDFVTYTVQL